MNERHPQTIEFAHPIIYSLIFFLDDRPTLTDAAVT